MPYYLPSSYDKREFVICSSLQLIERTIRPLQKHVCSLDIVIERICLSFEYEVDCTWTSTYIQQTSNILRYNIDKNHYKRSN